MNTTSNTLSNTLNTTLENNMTTLTSQTTNLVLVNIASTLVREKLTTPKQAMVISMAFTENLDRLLGSGTQWVARIENTLEEVTLDDESVDMSDVSMIDVLRLSDFIYNLGNEFIAGEALMAILDLDKTSYAPILASEGIVDRKRNYARIKTSDLFKEAVHALEESPFMVSNVMLHIAKEVFEVTTDIKLLSQQYVLDGTKEMISGKAYISEFFGDTRGRLYQACCFGPNGQSSDFARSLMDFHGVSKEYNIADTKAILLEELHDMGSWADDKAFRTDYLSAVNSPIEFVLNNTTKQGNVTKVWNFVKFSMLIQEIGRFEKGERKALPYVGVAVGYDAKCSGPQLGALMVADERMLASCGFSLTKQADAYHNAIAECELVGINNLTRSLVKKTFMAVFYGASAGAMLDANTITQATYDALYDGLNEDEMEAKAQDYYKAINKSFGAKLNNIRRKFKEAGIIYGNEANDYQQTAKYDKPVKHLMCDGLEVAMNYKKRVDLEGTLCITTPNTITKIETSEGVRYFKNLSFNTKDVDYVSYARNGFVNMIQATDALVARLIVVNLKRLGVQHIISIHDCFRVNIHDTAKLQEAIKLAYLELFGSSHNTVSDDMVEGCDIIGLYFKGSLEATADMYKDEAPKGSQFYGKDAIRRLDEIQGLGFTSLVESLDVTEVNGTYYFAK